MLWKVGKTSIHLSDTIYKLDMVYKWDKSLQCYFLTHLLCSPSHIFPVWRDANMYYENINYFLATERYKLIACISCNPTRNWTILVGGLPANKKSQLQPHPQLKKISVKIVCCDACANKQNPNRDTCAIRKILVATQVAIGKNVIISYDLEVVAQYLN